jgi:hypothetical protein
VYWINLIENRGSNGFFCVNKVIQKVKVKVKFTLEETTKTQKGSRGIALIFL